MSTKASVLVRKRTMFAGLSPRIFFLQNAAEATPSLSSSNMACPPLAISLSSVCHIVWASKTQDLTRKNGEIIPKTWRPDKHQKSRLTWKIMEDMCFSLPLNHHGFWGDNLGRTFSGEVVNPPTAFEWNKATRISAKTALQKPKPVRQRH